MGKKKVVVSIVIGSDSDLPYIEGCISTLKEFDVPYEVRVLSAHRTPADTTAFAKGLRNRGVKVVIACAGGAAHLGGVIASHTLIPVIGIPVESGPLKGLDALLATVQMPVGIPVGTVALGKAGPKNAALLSIAVLSLSNKKLYDRLNRFRDKMRKDVKMKDLKLKV